MLLRKSVGMGRVLVSAFSAGDMAGIHRDRGAGMGTCLASGDWFKECRSPTHWRFAMMSGTSCCSHNGLSAERVGSALASGPERVEPAEHRAARPSGASAEVLVVGSIVTNNPAAPSAEAMAISGGRIIGMGTQADVEGLVTPSTTTVKPDGFILPGFIEPHAHIWTALINYANVDVSHNACPTFDDVVATIKTAVSKTPSGQIVMCKNFDPSLYPGEPNLTRNILDQIAPSNPVVVWNASLHFMYVNSEMFTLAGITDQTPDPAGGTFERADGKLTGVLGEPGAELMILSVLPKLTMTEITTWIRDIMATFAAQGVTSMREAGTGMMAGPKELALLHQLNGQSRFPLRVSTAQFAASTKASPTEVAAQWKAAGVTPFSGDEMVRADAWKVVADGSNQGRSGYFLQPYLGEDNGGRADFTPEALRATLKAGLDDGWQLMVHTNGDAAVEFALEALEELLPSYGSTDLRHRLEHCSFTTDDQLDRMAAAGLSPSFLMNHLYYWGAAFRDTILGAKRTERLDRAASAYRAGLRPSLHSDYNVTDVHPLLSARTAVLRQTQADGRVINSAECVTPEQALAAITTDAAWQVHADDRGSLEVGKLADFGIADQDPWGSDPSGWADITFHATYVGGSIAWENS